MSGTGPPWSNIGYERGVTDSTRQHARRHAIPHTPSKPSQHATQLSPSPYGNSAAKLLETNSITSSTSTSDKRTSTRPTISTYQQSTTPSAHLPTSPPYTAGYHSTSFYSPSVFRIPNAPPTTPDSDSASDSDSDVFNPFSKTSQRPIQAMMDPRQGNEERQPPQLMERRATPLYSYPSSYEHTLLPSGLYLASPFGSPALSPRVEQFNTDRAFPGGEGDAIVRGSGWVRPDREENTNSPVVYSSGWILRESEGDADNEESSSDDDRARHFTKPSDSQQSTSIIDRHGAPQGEEDYCQVFAKTTTFDPFSVDDYAPRVAAETLSIKLPAAAAGNGKDALVDVGDSARRASGLGDTATSMSGGEGDEMPTERESYFCGSSRYLMIGGLGPECDQNRLRECIEAKVEINTVVGKYLDPHGIAIIIFHDHRAAGFVHQAIQCGALHLSGKQEQVYVKFLKPEEVHRILGNAIRPCLNSNEAKVCITFESSASLIFPPVEQLKRTLSTFGDLQEFRTIGASDNAFLAIFCDSRIGPVAINSLNKKFIGNAHLRLTLTCPLPDDESTLPTVTEQLDPHTQEITDARDLARHLARVNASSGFEPDVFQTQSWIGIPSPREHLDCFRAPYHTPTKAHPFDLQNNASPTFESSEWDRATEFGSPLQTPTKNRQSNISRRVDDLYGLPITPESKKRTKTVEFDLEPKPSTLIEQLNAKFANLHTPFTETPDDHNDGVYSEDEDIKPFRNDQASTHCMKTTSLPATPLKSLSNYSSSTWPRGTGLGSDSLSSFPTPSPVRQPYSLHTTPQHAARIGRQARQVEIMKNVPKEMMIHMDALKSGSDPRTSVMIKDIPNKLSRKQLINCIQEITPGEIDFVYLRFDFQNQCNVAYAFVNFTSVSALYRFATARLGQKWGVFSSEKSFANDLCQSTRERRFHRSFCKNGDPCYLMSEAKLFPFPAAEEEMLMEETEQVMHQHPQGTFSIRLGKFRKLK